MHQHGKTFPQWIATLGWTHWSGSARSKQQTVSYLLIYGCMSIVDNQESVCSHKSYFTKTIKECESNYFQSCMTLLPCKILCVFLTGLIKVFYSVIQRQLYMWIYCQAQGFRTGNVVLLAGSKSFCLSTKAHVWHMQTFHRTQNGSMLI